MAKNFIVWVYYTGGDDRSNGSIAGVCSTESLAKGAAKGKGWYGGDGHVEKRDALEHDGEIFLLSKEVSNPVDLDGMQAAKDERLKQETLAKLSAEERRVLGLK